MSLVEEHGTTAERRGENAAAVRPGEHPLPRRSLRWRVVLLWALSAALLLGVGWWAGSVTSEPPVVPQGKLSTVLYTVEEGAVERVVSYPAAATWPSVPAGVNGATGTLTSIDVTPGQHVSAGSVLYTVDLRPAVAAAGKVPAFRDLGPGAVGADVRQLETFLVGRDLLAGPADDTFTRATGQAVRRWQSETGVVPDGVVRRGDLVFLATLPTAVFLVPDLEVGSAVASGQAAVRAVTGPPVFTVTLAREQAELVPLDAQARVRLGDRHRDGVVHEALSVAPDQVALTLTAPDGSVLCEQRCSQDVPVGKESHFTADLFVVPPTIGPVVPTAAIVTTGGRTVVRLEGGALQPVRVLASADGRSVVSGLDVGTSVQLSENR